MSRRPHALAAMLLAAALPAQAESLADQPLAALHRAWITEVLDLDTASATRQYARVAREGRVAQPERWVAAARLAELARLGVATPATLGMAEAPTQLRAAWADAPPAIDANALVLQLRNQTTTTPPDLLGTDTHLLELRPLVPDAESWLMAQTGPSLRDRRRQRMQAFANLSRSPEVSSYLLRMYATMIVNAEVNGRRSQADALRSLYFANWRPPATDGEDMQVVTAAVAAMDVWMAEDLSNQQRSVLTSLREHVLRRAQADPNEARLLLLRLPRIAERLFGK